MINRLKIVGNHYSKSLTFQGGSTADDQFGYSEWFPVPARNVYMWEIKDDIKFQLRTDKRVTIRNILSAYFRGASWFVFGGGGRLQAHGCESAKGVISPNAGFYLRVGDLTFLKTTTQLQIWFDDVLEATWIYENRGSSHCSMKRKASAMRLDSNHIATHYRYQLSKSLLYSSYARISY